MSEFHIECFYNEFLPQGAHMVHAVLSVEVSGTGSPGVPDSTQEERSELLIVDTSGSMSGKKLRAAKAATAAAIDCIPDGVRFGIISGKHKAEMAYPPTPPLSVASARTRSVAKAAVKKLESGGGTAMGSWIELAGRVLGGVAGIRHAILLTDGKNENEEPEELDEALARAESVFQCDCRGVGADWSVPELRKVATTLLGTYDIVPDPSLLEEDFSSMMMQALSKQVAEVTLRVWTPQSAEVVALKQMDPPLDLTGSRADAGPLTGDYATGSWGDEVREYYLSIRVPAGEVDDEMLAARVTMMVGEEPVGQCLVKAVWTDDTAKSTQINKQVAEAMAGRELADALDEAVDSFRMGDHSAATDRFNKAFRIAKDRDNKEVLEYLRHVVDEDPVTGRVRPKPKVEDVDMMILEARSQRVARAPRPTSPDEPAVPGEQA
jgi:VWA domain-containing protein